MWSPTFSYPPTWLIENFFASRSLNRKLLPGS